MLYIGTLAGKPIFAGKSKSLKQVLTVNGEIHP